MSIEYNYSQDKWESIKEFGSKLLGYNEGLGTNFWRIKLKLALKGST